MKNIFILILIVLGSKVFAQKTIVFAANEKTQQIIVSEINERNNQIKDIEKVSCANNELLYSFILKLQTIAQRKNVDIEQFEKIDMECRKIYFNQ